MNAERYQILLEDTLLPFSDDFFPDGFILQQDNAPPHRAKSTKLWLLEHNIDIFEWPPYSPDLNPTENLFGLLVRRVYRDNIQYSTVNELKTAIMFALAEIPQETLLTLVKSMHKRLIDVIMNHGGSTKY